MAMEHAVICMTKLGASESEPVVYVTGFLVVISYVFAKFTRRVA